jgi:hypothetical protein
MYRVLYFIDEHDLRYGPSRRVFTDPERALKFATTVQSLGVYDHRGYPITAPVQSTTTKTVLSAPQVSQEATGSAAASGGPSNQESGKS